MQGVASRSRPPHTDRGTRNELTQLAAHLGFTWSALRTPTVNEWSDDLVLVLDEAVPWLMGPVERDPLHGRFGTTVLPRAARIQLNQIEGLRVPFQRLAFAHELNPVGPVEPFLPALRTGPHTCTPEMARDLVGDVPAHPGVSGVVAMLDWFARGLRPATDPNSGAAQRRLSRIIFGVIAPTWPRDGQLCLWFPLTAWRW